MVKNLCYTEKDKYDIAYTWNLKKLYKWTYLQNRNRLMDTENKCMLNGKGWRDKLGDWDWDIYTTVCKIDH